ncbi:unnamed protein product [Lactuca virosa]|uniref:MADS-box domain-containing protein n=1 Tax=Lactuca virosa TaxID=75947 RepID=A0AAU9N811_9ASTR|nr:unnamed protein product [Lactuca virosa]
MGRWKVPMEHINNSKKHNLTFQTRKNGIIKKALELSTLCDVNVSMIIHTDHQESEILPPDPHKFTTELYKRKSHYGCRGNSEVELRELALKLDSKINNVKNKVESLKDISKIHNQDNYTIYPTTTIAKVNADSSSMMPSSNLFLGDYDDLSLDHKELISDENNDCYRHYHHENLSVQPSFSPESLMPPFNHCPMDDNKLGFDPTQLLNELGFSPDILPPFSDQNNMIMHPSELDLMMKLITSEDDTDHFDH